MLCASQGRRRRDYRDGLIIGDAQHMPIPQLLAAADTVPSLCCSSPQNPQIHCVARRDTTPCSRHAGREWWWLADGNWSILRGCALGTKKRGYSKLSCLRQTAFLREVLLIHAGDLCSNPNPEARPCRHGAGAAAGGAEAVPATHRSMLLRLIIACSLQLAEFQATN